MPTHGEFSITLFGHDDHPHHGVTTDKLCLFPLIAQDRPNRASSLDWIGNLQGVRKLVSRGSLGRFKEDTLFFGNEDIARLGHLSGRIYRVKSGQSGIIKAYGLDFFFTPSPRIGHHQFVRERDDNLPVTFYASFSYDGPRAWNVEPA